jgi:N12 class adenine-specific DNA methylase
MADWQIPQGPYEPPESAAAEDYANIPAAGAAGGAANVAEAALRGLTPSILGRAAERGAQPGASAFDIGVAAAGGRFGGEVMPGTEAGWAPNFEPPPPDPHQAEELPPDVANDQYAPRGPDGKPISITDKPISRGMAQVIGKQKADETELDSRLQRTAAYNFWPERVGIELAVGLLDPANAALAVVPGIGEEAILERLATAGLTGFGARTAARVAAGAATGAVQAVPYVALQGAMAKEEGDEFGMREALDGVFQQAVLGAAIHAGIGAVKEAWPLLRNKILGRPLGEPEPAPMPPAPGSPETRAAVPETAFTAEREDALRTRFEAPEQAGVPVDLAEAGFAPHEIEALKRDGLVAEDGTMSEDQFAAWRDERELRQPAEPTAAAAEPERVRRVYDTEAQAQRVIRAADLKGARVEEAEGGGFWLVNEDGTPYYTSETQIRRGAAPPAERPAPEAAAVPPEGPPPAGTKADADAKYQAYRAAVDAYDQKWAGKQDLSVRDASQKYDELMAIAPLLRASEEADAALERPAVPGEVARDALPQSPVVRGAAMQAGIAQVMDGRPVDVQPVIDAAAAQPKPIRTIADIMQQDGVGLAKAKRTQQAELLARGRIIPPEEGGAGGQIRMTPAEAVDRQRDLQRNGYVTGVPGSELGAATEQLYAPKPAEEAPKPEAVAREAAAAKPAAEGEAKPGAPAAPAPIRTVQQIMDQERVGAKRAAEIQTEELLARGKPVAAEEVAERKARVEALPPANKLAARVGEAAGVENSADKAPEQIYDEVVERLPAEQVAAEIDSHEDARAATFEEAEKQAADWIVYHGTPHFFERVEPGHVGTGEGVQAYGWGVLYAAEQAGVANQYRLDLTAPRALSEAEQQAATAMSHHGGDRAAAAAALDEHAAAATVAEVKRTGAAAADLIRSGWEEPKETEGHLLTLRLKFTPGEALDWDRPLDTATLAKVSPIFEKNDDGRFLRELAPASLTGENVYKRLAAATMPAEASAALHAAGIKGIRYLDQGSRGSFDRVKWKGEKLVSAAAEKGLGASDFGAIVRELQRQSPSDNIDEAVAKAREHAPSIAEVLERHRADLTIEPPTRNVVVFDHNDVEITHRNGVAVEPHAMTEAEAAEAAPTAPAGRPQAIADQLYGEANLRPEEDISNEVQQANSTAPVRPGEGGAEQPGAPAGHPGPLPAERGPRPSGAGAGERPGEERAGQPVAGAAAGERAGAPAGAAEAGRAGAAPERARDSRGNLIFKEGERVVIPEGEHLAGRHGTIEEATSVVWQAMLGGKRSEPSYHYTVRTDGGETAIGSKFEPEVGEAPKVVPDPVYAGHPMEAKRLADSAAYDRTKAAQHDRAEARARTPTGKKAQRQAAAERRRDADAKEAVLQAWRAKHPEAAAGVVPEPETPGPAAPPRAGNMALVETAHTKGGYPLYVVTMSEKVPRERYTELAAGAKEGGGYYSSWRGEGGVPGFQFKDRAAAETFLRRYGEAPEASTPTEVTEQAGQSQPPPPLPGPAPTPETPQARDIADGIAPAQGKGPLPVTTEPPRPPTEARPEAVAKPPEGPPPPKAEPTEAGFGAKNKIYTRERADRARAILRAKAGELRTGIDPEMAQAGIDLAGYYIEGGVRAFADYTKAMAAELGDKYRPYLRSWYEAIRHDPNVDTRGMTPYAEIEAIPFAPEGAEHPEPLNEYEAQRLYNAHYGTAILEDISQRIADGETPAEIADSYVGGTFTEPEIVALADELERDGKIPAPTEPEEEEEGGLQANLPLGAEGERPETVPGAAPGGEAGPARPEGVPGGERPAGGPPEEQPAGQPRQPQPQRRARGGGGGAGALPRIPDAGEGPEPGAAGRSADANVTGANWQIGPGSLEEARGPKLKANDNLAAIELAKRLTEENRPATKAEQAILAKYVGWGGLKGAFEDNQGNFGKGFEDIGARLKGLLSDEEYRTAAQSTQYAHYTSETVVRRMWDAVRRMGFKGGLVFEPGMGTGNFIGMMPADIAEKSQYQGIERDHITAQIAKLLYPESGVREADYIKTPMPEGQFDLVIGNPPFSDTVVHGDPKYAARGFTLHNYFFAKSLDSVRPGGLLGFITSHYTMDAVSDDARRYLAERAEFVGGIRLNSDAFMRNARTPVTTDILFFQKRPEGRIEVPEGQEPPWMGVVSRGLAGKTAPMVEGNVSRYFSEHPENVLGEESFQGKMQPRDDYTVSPRPGSDLDADLASAVERLPEGIMTEPPSPEERAKLDFASGQKKDGSFYIGPDGKLMQYEGGAGREVPKHGVTGGMSAGDREKVQHLIPIRDALPDVFQADLARDDARGAEARKRLSAHYDSFVAQHGPINLTTLTNRKPTLTQIEEARLEAREDARSIDDYWNDGDFDPSEMLLAKAKVSAIAKARDDARQAAIAAGRKFNEGSFDPDDVPDIIDARYPNVRAFMSDPESYRLRSIENYDLATGAHSKKPIFERSILKFDEEPELKSAQDGVLWSYNKLGRFDLDAIAEKMGRDRASLVGDLGDSIFKVPNKGDTYQTKDEYLSGDVTTKLEEARAAAETDPEVRRNISALEAALPPPVPPPLVDMIVGMPWIPKETVEEFARDHLDLGDVHVARSKTTGTWFVGGEGKTAGAAKWGTPDRTALQLLSDAMNRTPPRIYQWEGSGSDRRQVFDEVATQAAADKIKAIAGYMEDGIRFQGEFEKWVHSDQDRADQMAKIYNDALNRSVLRQFDGSYLTTPGISSTWKWFSHQLRAVARVVQAGNTYLAHAVGAGKTAEMIGAAMEMRRLGLIRKALFAVPNHMLAQFTKEFYEQYPTAKIAVADEQRFHTSRRKQFVANVAQDDLDAIIMTHSSFGKIPISDEFQEHLIREQLAQLEQALGELQGPDARFARGRVENQKEKLEQRLARKGDGTQDQTLTFEELGADFLFVDEAHEFRKLTFATKQSGVKGITPEGSNKAWDLYTKVRYLDSQRPGRSVVFASGTPVTNTMGELYSLSRYMQPQALAARGLSHFDSWAQAFGDTKTGLEENAAGGYKPQTRFGQFVNMPELYKMVGETMDIVTPSELEQYVTRPAVKGGSRQLHMAPRTPILDDYQARLADRMDAIEARKGPPEKGMDILLSVINDGRHAAIDPRFVEQAQSDPRSKLNMMVQNVARIYHATGDVQFYDPRSGYKEPSFRGPATQMIFANLGVNGRGPANFSGYQWIREALRREGVPAQHIAFIGDYGTALARQNLFNDMNDGKVRILIGSTQKMGTGVNAQRRLIAIHNQDPLWYPADDEQRIGRILRQGNHNPEVEIHDYTTKGTYDSAMWGMMGKKGRFIEQFFRGDPNLRHMEDVGEASMYEQASAMATTDERIMAFTELRQAYDREKRREGAHNQEQYSLRTKLAYHRDNADYQERSAASISRDIANRQETKGDQFSMLVGGEKLEKRADAAIALDKFIDEHIKPMGDKGAPITLGRIGGFALRGDKSGWKGTTNYWLSLDSGNRPLHADTGDGLIKSAEANLRGLENDKAYAERQRAEHLQAAENIRPLIGQRFDTTKLQELRRQVDAMQAMFEAEAEARKASKIVAGIGAHQAAVDRARGIVHEGEEGGEAARPVDPEMEEAERRIAAAGEIDPEDRAAIAQATQAEHEAQQRAQAIDEAAKCLRGGE